jgi:uncharacterized protein YyaL (SSP411 family)
MVLETLDKMNKGGIHDQVGNGFARYSVTKDWSLPHFEKMLYDQAQLLPVYLDAYLATKRSDLLEAVHDIATAASSRQRMQTRFTDHPTRRSERAPSTYGR